MKTMRSICVVLLTIAAVFVPQRFASAEHTVITKSEVYYGNSNWNGIKVFLSSPRHEESGGVANGRPRECRNPGWEENINGRFWNFWSANTNYYDAQYDSGNPYRNLRSRGYAVAIGANNRLPGLEGAVASRKTSNNWHATVHLPSHTNGTSGCPSNTYGNIWIHQSGNERSSTFADVLRARLGRALYGGPSDRRAANFHELGALAPYRAYGELIHHDHNPSNAFFSGDNGKNVQRDAWRYGWAIDAILGYPR